MLSEATVLTWIGASIGLGKSLAITVSIGSIQIGPVFVMMAVATLVVHPGVAVALVLPLGGVGTAIALIIAHTASKFRRGVLG